MAPLDSQTGLSAAQRSARARIAGLSAHAQGRTNTGPALAAAEARFARQVIEEAAARGEPALSEAEVVRRAWYARKLFYARLSYQSAKARSARSTRPPRVTPVGQE